MKKRIISLILAALMLTAAFAAAALAEETADNELYVYTENKKPLNVRSAPNGEVIGSLPYGTKVRVQSFINDNWAVISYHYADPTNGEGDWPAYVNRRYLIPVVPEELEKVLEAEKEKYTGDPLTDINNEFAAAKTVEPYKVTVRPARVTSWANMRWIPSETGMIIAQYKATEELTVLKELDNYLMVQDPDTGDVGYIHRKYAAR